jgi:hypothetical protein
MTMARIFLMSVLCFALPAVTDAATLYLDPGTSTLAAGQEVRVSAFVHSDSVINTIGTAVVIPTGLEFREAKKENLIQDWVDQPMYDPITRSVSFSGIVPGGWHGTGTFLTIVVRAQKAGLYALKYDPLQTEIYQNDGRATREPVMFGTIERTSRFTSLLLGAIVTVIAFLVWFFRRHKMHIRFV